VSHAERKELMLQKRVKEKCSECGGKGITWCDYCGGDKSFETRGGDPCPACGGDGKHKCVPCNGTGYVMSEE
jgi:DnaJ-class molecular chaperone